MDSKIAVENLLGMAVKIESDGAEFYLKASKRVNNPEACRELKKLEEMEIEHKKIFSEMKSQYSKSNIDAITQDKDPKIENDLNIFQDNRIFNFNTGIYKTITDDRALLDIINMAITLEKDTIVFYSGLVNLITAESFNNVLNKVIREEISHLAILANLPIF